MLGKLIKLETKASARFLLPTYLILIVISIINRIILTLDLNEGLLMLIPTISVFTYIASMVVVLVTTFILMISRFYKNYLTDEGYLMFTLPVKTRDLILSKLIVTFCYTIISVLTALLSVLIVFATTERMKEIQQGISQIYNEIVSFNINMAFAIVVCSLLLVFSIALNILNVYASIALGQLYKKHKLLGSFIAYMIIYTVLQAAGIIVVAIASLIQVSIRFSPASIFYIFTIITAIVTVILSGIFYYITSYMFRKKLNLD